MRPTARSRFVFAAGVAVHFASSPARADGPDRDACVSAYEQAQVGMRRGALRAARESLGVCLQEGCPKALRSDCAHWLDEVEARLPAVILSCEAPDGRPRSDVRVLVDGAPLVDRLEGRAIEIDPGEHTFRFEPQGAEAIEVRYVVHEGDKVQRVIARPAASSGARDAREAHEAGARRVPWTVWALGGVGVAAAGGFAIAGVAGMAGKDDLEPCKPDCPSSQVSDVRTKFIVADVLLAVSVVALGAATYLFFTRPAASPVGKHGGAGLARHPLGPRGGSLAIGF